MNLLNKRNTFVKNLDNRKIYESLIILPKFYESSDLIYCKKFKNAANANEQITIVEEFLQLLCQNIDVDTSELLQFLMEVLMFAPPKHPVKHKIFAYLKAQRARNKNCNYDVLATAVKQSIQHLIEDTLNEASNEHWVTTICSLVMCWSLIDAKELLSNQKDNLLYFGCKALERFLNELHMLNSTALRKEYNIYIHELVRLQLFCMQFFSTKTLLKWEEQELCKLNDICIHIIEDEEQPMDVRKNAGMLIVAIAEICNKYEQLIDDLKLNKPQTFVVCLGVLSKINSTVFIKESGHIRDICSLLDKIINNKSNVSNMLICGTNALLDLSKSFVTMDLKEQRCIDDAKLILRNMLMFAFNYLEHAIDRVRHMCKDILRNIVKLTKHLNFDLLLKKIFDSCNSNRLSLQMKCTVLQVVTSVLGAKETLKNCNNIFNKLLLYNLGVDYTVNEFYKELLLSSHNVIDFEEWYGIWIEFLLAIAIENDDRLSQIDEMIVEAVKCEPKIVPKIVQHSNPKVPMSTKLSVMWCVRKSGIQVENFDEIMTNFSENILMSLMSNSEETRIKTLRLLVETYKASEMMTPLECRHLITYMEYNCNCQSAATRQKTIALYNKAMLRLKLNIMRSLRENKRNNLPILDLPILKFLRKFLNMLMKNLFVGANYSRRSISLHLLERCLHICIQCNLSLKDFMPERTINALMESLVDPNEANKKLAVNILKLIEDEQDCSLVEDYKLDISVDKIKTLLVSLRPMDSVTAAYQLDYYCHHMHTQLFGNYEHVEYEPSYYAALRWLLAQLQEGLDLAQQSLLRAAKLNPLYGLLFAIKHQLNHLEFDQLKKFDAWRIYISELIIICIKLCMVVGPVVNNSSPEGHLPNDFSELPAEYAELNDDLQDQCAGNILSCQRSKPELETMKTTPQMILLCAWRTVMEVSLILGKIVFAPISYNKDNAEFLVTKKQIIEIGTHFRQLLLETKHRGAFEQASVGFAKVCQRLWGVHEPELNALPMQWLRDIIKIISDDEQLNEKISATRRSAGVPLMVQGIVTSELKALTTCNSLSFCMTRLLQVCTDPERSAEARTHSMNILRTLFRCADLNEAVGEYISDGVMCAIRSYESDTWSERNSANLLFSALMTRIFGVQRNKDSNNLDKRNKMTGRIFFLRYPNLYPFLLQQLKESCSLVLRAHKVLKLYAILLILGRLYESPFEDNESKQKLGQFTPYLLDCASSAEMQTRSLAAKTLTSLVAEESITCMIIEQCGSIVLTANAKTLDLNMWHGKLLQILELLKVHKHKDESLIHNITLTLVVLFTKTQIQNEMILSTIFDIYIEILVGIKSWNGFSEETRKTLLFFITQTINPTVLNYFIYNLHAHRLTLEDRELCDYLVFPPVLNGYSLVKHTECSLNIIMLILLRSANASPKEIDEFEISTDETNFVNSLTREKIMHLSTLLRMNSHLHSYLKTVIRQRIFYPDCTIKGYAVLSMLHTFDFKAFELMNLAKTNSVDLKSAISMCLERLIVAEELDYNTAQKYLEYLAEISQPWNPNFLRFKAAMILSHLAPYFPRAVERRDLYVSCLYTELVLSLLMDEDYIIRDWMSQNVLRNVPITFGLQSVVSTMAQRLFLQYIANLLGSTHANEYFICDLFRGIVDCMNDANPCDIENTLVSDEMVIFDKNEANVYAEPQKVISDMRFIFETTFDQLPKVLEIVKSYKCS